MANRNIAAADKCLAVQNSPDNWFVMSIFAPAKRQFSTHIRCPLRSSLLGSRLFPELQVGTQIAQSL